MFTYIYLKTIEEVREKIQECEGKHSQQVAYSTFHDKLTQICYECKCVRTMFKLTPNQKKGGDTLEKK